jgi:3-deoxy-D-manno-octulosonate 8-phosphate phosphatase (KDO 8-P phosphatase)
MTESLRVRLARVRLLACDVDGTLTDGGITFDSAGNEARRFHTHDGLGIVLAGTVGLRTVWITGRDSPLVARRARELGVTDLLQGVRDKASALAQLGARLAVAPDEIAFIGDDLNDLPGMRFAGVALAPADAARDVRAAADLVVERPGGSGAVREAIEAILRARGDWDAAVATYLAALTAPSSTLKPGQ